MAQWTFFLGLKRVMKQYQTQSIQMNDPLTWTYSILFLISFLGFIYLTRSHTWTKLLFFQSILSLKKQKDES